MSEIKKEEDNNVTKEIIDFLKDLAIIVIVVKLITIFLVSIFIINGQSMYASYYDKEIILVDRFSLNTFGGLKKQDIKRGDVVVLEPGVDKNKKYFIKRVIGLPGEELKIKDGNVFIKKVGSDKFIKLDEKYLNKENYGHTEVNYQKSEKIYKIPEGKYFVMGDNRNHSSDSRSCFSYNCNITDRDNFISSDKIIGKVLLDLGYLNTGIHFIDSKGNIDFKYTGTSFTHPVIKENGKYISTKPKWTHSVDSYNY